MSISGARESQSEDAVFEAALRLNPEALDQLVARLLAARAKRQAPHLPAREAELLQRINAGLPSDLLSDCGGLIQKRRMRTLTDSEHAELLELTEKVEELQARRLEDLMELANFRRTTLDGIIQELGIRPLCKSC